MRLFQAFYRLFKEQASRAHGVCIGTSAVLLYSHRQKVMCEDRRVMLAAVNILHMYFTTTVYISYFFCTLSGSNQVICDKQGVRLATVLLVRLCSPCILNSLQSLFE